MVQDLFLEYLNDPRMADQALSLARQEYMARQSIPSPEISLEHDSGRMWKNSYQDEGLDTISIPEINEANFVLSAEFWEDSRLQNEQSTSLVATEEELEELP